MNPRATARTTAVSADCFGPSEDALCASSETTCGSVAPEAGAAAGSGRRPTIRGRRREQPKNESDRRDDQRRYGRSVQRLQPEEQRVEERCDSEQKEHARHDPERRRTGDATNGGLCPLPCDRGDVVHHRP